uniref:Putative secreted protein n=1 Tax=Ixodes ricinus TaxID=34613 RepID=A0A6B0UVX0_IXORI
MHHGLPFSVWLGATVVPPAPGVPAERDLGQRHFPETCARLSVGHAVLGGLYGLRRFPRAGRCQPRGPSFRRRPEEKPDCNAGGAVGPLPVLGGSRQPRLCAQARGGSSARPERPGVAAFCGNGTQSRRPADDAATSSHPGPLCGSLGEDARLQSR